MYISKQAKQAGQLFCPLLSVFPVRYTFACSVYIFNRSQVCLNEGKEEKRKKLKKEKKKKKKKEEIMVYMILC